MPTGHVDGSGCAFLLLDIGAAAPAGQYRSGLLAWPSRWLGAVRRGPKACPRSMAATNPGRWFAPVFKQPEQPNSRHVRATRWRCRVCRRRSFSAISSSFCTQFACNDPDQSMLGQRDFPGMSMSDEASFFSRFFMKFVEIIAAGLATAVSGYLIAHLGGLLAAPAPATPAVQVDPSASETSRSLYTPPVPPSVAPRQEADAPAAEPARKSTTATVAPPPRKPIKTETSTAEGNPRGEDALEAQVRAALANMGTNRASPLDVPPRQADVPPRPAALRPEPRPLDVPPSVAVMPVAPRAADLQPKPLQQAPVPPRSADRGRNKIAACRRWRGVARPRVGAYGPRG